MIRVGQIRVHLVQTHKDNDALDQFWPTLAAINGALSKYYASFVLG